MPEQKLTVVDKLVILILAFHDAHPDVPVEDIKAFTKAIGDVTTDFALDVTRDVIGKTLKIYEEN